MLCSIDIFIIKHICQMVAGYDLWPKSNQITEYFAGARLQLLMEHCRKVTHFYMLIYMLKHNINVKTLGVHGTGEKYSLVLCLNLNQCIAPVHIFFRSSSISWASITASVPRAQRKVIQVKAA